MRFTVWFWAQLQTAMIILAAILQLPIFRRFLGNWGVGCSHIFGYRWVGIALAIFIITWSGTCGLCKYLTSYLLTVSGFLSLSSLLLLINSIHIAWVNPKRPSELANGHQAPTACVNKCLRPCVNNWLTAVERQLLLNMALLAGLILYPAVLSGWGYHLYAWGFTSNCGSCAYTIAPAVCVNILPVGVAIGTAWAFSLNHRTLAYLGLISLWAWLLNLGESNNLWDYLLDPWLFLYALIKAVPVTYVKMGVWGVPTSQKMGVWGVPTSQRKAWSIPPSVWLHLAKRFYELLRL